MSDKEINKSNKDSRGCMVGLVWSLGLFAFGLVLLVAMDLDNISSTSKREGARLQKAAEQREKIEDKRKGLHCLSSWNGAHHGVVRDLKARLKDPKSFEHISTRVTPVNNYGYHSLVMEYRAKNSFGGYVEGRVLANFRNTDCVHEIQIEE